jgi:diguanylate cyclase (GGDEF)-like protein
MDALAPGTAFGGGRTSVFRRPEGVAEGIRWLFVWLAVLSVVLTLPGVLVSARGELLALGLAAALALAASWIFGYRTGRAPLWLDVVDSVAMVGIALASPKAAAVVVVIFGALWFRTVYGSAWRSLIRVCLYAAALGSLFVLWPLVRGQSVGTDPTLYLGLLPTLFLTVVIARQLGNTLIARDQSIRRDRILAATGSQLIGETDSEAIMALAWTAAAEFCSATPGLRLIKVISEDSVLRVSGAAGSFRSVPDVLAAEVLFTRPGSAFARVLDPAPLNAAVGTPMMWECLGFEGRADGGWLLVGARNKVPAEAILSVRGLMSQISLAIRTSDAHRDLATQARTDSLTRLENRASFLVALSASLGAAGGDGAAADGGARPAGVHVLFLDLDDFKDVNDGLGHRAGDQLLIGVAARMLRCSRPTDLCARLGGDEFAVLLRDATAAAAFEIAQRMVDSIAEPFFLSGRAVQVGVSIGIATASPGADVEELVHEADVAMYAAKAKGKRRVEVFASGLLNADRNLAASL